MRLFFFFLLLLFYADPSFAQQQNADSVYTLPPIHVTALRIPVARAHAPARISVFSPETIAATSSRNLAELLDRAGSGFIRKYGSGLATLSLRGTSSSQTLILLDGIPLSDPQLGQMDLLLLPTAFIDEVQVLHGQGSALYGSQSMGGVINLKSRQNLAPYFLKAAAGAGPYQERTGQLFTGLTRGAVNTLIAVSHKNEKGDFPYLNASLFPVQTSRRNGADLQSTSAFAKVSLNQRSAATSVSGWLNDTERGLPGTATTTPRDERQWDHNSRLQLQHLTTAAPGLLLFSAAMQKNALRYLNPQIDIDQTGHTSVTTLNVELSQLDLPFLMATGVSGNLYRATHPNLIEKASESQFSWFANGIVANKRAGVFPALRVDTYFPASGKNLAALSPSLGFNGQPISSAPLRLKGSIGRAFRSPTFNDRFWQPGGNPNLKPEHGWHYEAGAVYTLLSRLIYSEVEFTGFSHKISNQITWLPDNKQIWSPQNIGVTRTDGLEATAATTIKFSPQNSLTTHFGYTLADSRDKSDPNTSSFNQPLRYTPRHIYNSSIGIARKAALMLWNLDLMVRHVGRRYVTTDGSQYLKPYTTADVHLRITRAAGRATFTAGLFFENITDEVYEAVKGYPMPPRLMRFQLSVQLHGEE